MLPRFCHDALQRVACSSKCDQFSIQGICGLLCIGGRRPQDQNHGMLLLAHTVPTGNRGIFSLAGHGRQPLICTAAS